MYTHFGLVLMVNHACNLRCSYCYTGAKFSRAMPEEVGLKAINRAVASLAPGGTLELGFFGGEPLLEAARIAAFIEQARTRTRDAGVRLFLGLTTNGTQTYAEAWSLLTLPDLDLAVSHDGLPHLHDRHRRYPDGRGSSEAVLATLLRLLDAGKEFRVIIVVRPDNVDELPDSIEYLSGLGVRRFEPSLDLWTRWSSEDGPRLERAVVRCAQIWRDGLPEIGLSWFDEKAAHLMAAPLSQTARCAFGDGQIAVAPSGRLYPCERSVNERYLFFRTHHREERSQVQAEFREYGRGVDDFGRPVDGSRSSGPVGAHGFSFGIDDPHQTHANAKVEVDPIESEAGLVVRRKNLNGEIRGHVDRATAPGLSRHLACERNMDVGQVNSPYDASDVPSLYSHDARPTGSHVISK